MKTRWIFNILQSNFFLSFFHSFLFNFASCIYIDIARVIFDTSLLIKSLCSKRPCNSRLTLSFCNQKERVLKTQRTDCLHRTQASTFSWVTHIQLRPPKTQHTTYLLTLSNEHHEVIDLQAFCSYTTAEQDFNGSISCLTHSHRYQQGKLFCFITNSVHSPKTQARFLSEMFTTTSDSQHSLSSLSFSDSLAVTWLIVRRSGSF
jgi:hypothetical protein